MQIVTSVAAMQRLSADWKRRGVRVAFVPTMGCLHEGHMSLVGRARRQAGEGGKVVVSIYVNPSQFGPREDFARYPRDLEGDLRQCRGGGVDVVFAPGDDEMYPGGRLGGGRTRVVEEELSQGMEGSSRPGHFCGVTTVVAKLLNLVQPGVAVFGAKDWQQAAVVRRMVRDLNFPVRVVVSPTVREAGGLAMSSRNRYLSGGLRQQAGVLWRSIQAVRGVVRGAGGRPVRASELKRRVRRLVEREPAARLDYVEFFEPEVLTPVVEVRPGAHMALAVFVGKTRLIDNARL